MKYFKNKELSTLFNVSDKTVRNWIAASQQGKLELKLLNLGSKTYIADSIANNHLLEHMATNGKKYRNSRTHKSITPSSEFYTLFNPTQIIDIANTLDNYHELSWHYSYFGEAAVYRDKYLLELSKAGKSNLITNTIETLELSTDYINAFIEPYKYVNVVNVCVGNNVGVHKVLTNLQEQNKLKKFIAIDISPGMLEASERNIKYWFGDSILMEQHVLDIRHHSFGDIMAHDSYGNDASETVNLVFFVGGHIVNFRDPQQALQMISNSMNKNDLLFTSLKRDTLLSRGFFDFNIKSDQSPLGIYHKSLLDLLNIKETFYEPEQGFDKNAGMRYMGIRLKIGLSIKLMSRDFIKDVSFEKGDFILLWRARQYSDKAIVNTLNRANLSSIHISRSLDNELNLLISKINAV